MRFLREMPPVAATGLTQQHAHETVTAEPILPAHFVSRDQEAQRILRLAKASAIKARLELVRQKEILPAREFSEALGISPGALNREVKAYRLFAMELAGETYYPAFHLHRPADRMKIKRVCKALGDLDGWESGYSSGHPRGRSQTRRRYRRWKAASH